MTYRTRTTLMMLLLCGFSATAVFAEGGNDASNNGNDSATAQDLNRVQGNLERAITRATNGVAKSQDAARSAEKREHDGITTGIEAIQQQGKQLGDQLTDQNMAIIAEGQKTRRMFVEVSGGLALLLIVGAVVLRTRKGRNTKQLAPVLVMQSKEDFFAGKRPWIKFLNPTEDQLRKALMEAGLSEGLFFMTISSSDINTAPRMELAGVMIPGQKELMVRVPGSANLIAWKDKRRSKEVLQYARQNGFISSKQQAS